MRGFRCKNSGLGLMFLGFGILLAQVLPVGVIIFVSSLALIMTGFLLLRR